MPKKTICSLLLFSLVLPLYSQAAPKKKAKNKTITGIVHFYGSRYILKESKNNSGEWFILLESFILEDLVKNLSPTKAYEVKGKVYEFNRNKYILPLKFKVAKTPSEKVKAKKTKTRKKTKAKKK